jgi:hypothetical protein
MSGTSTSINFLQQGGWSGPTSTVAHNVGSKYKQFLTVDILARTGIRTVYNAATRAVVVDRQVLNSTLPTTARYFSFGLKRWFDLYDYKVYIPALTASEIEALI